MGALRFVAIAGGFALGAYCAARCVRQLSAESHRRSAKEEVANWENEGGNVPTVPTPTPTAPATYVPGTQ